MSDVKLFQGDCLEVMQSLIDDGVKADMVLTDPLMVQQNANGMVSFLLMKCGTV